MSPGPPTSAVVRRRLRHWVGFWLVIFIATHVPVTGTGPLVIKHADKALHFAMFFALTLLGAQYWRARRSLTTSRLVVWGLVYMAYGAVDEWLQQFVGRATSPEDFLADIAGVLASSVLLAVYCRSENLSEP